MTVAEMQHRMGSRELLEWEEFERLEGPLPPSRHDVLAAMQMSLFANAYRDRKARPEPFSAVDFLPSWARPEVPEPSEEDLLAKIEQWNAALGGLDLRGGDW